MRVGSLHAILFIDDATNTYFLHPRLGACATNNSRDYSHSIRYTARFIEHVEQRHGWKVEIAQKPESSRGFVPEKNRWPVERSFGWLNFRHRLFRDVEKTVESSEAMRSIAFISIILNRFAK